MWFGLFKAFVYLGVLNLRLLVIYSLKYISWTELTKPFFLYICATFSELPFDFNTVVNVVREVAKKVIF